MNQRSSSITTCCAVLLGLAGNALRADWKDEIGFTRLQQLAGSDLPTASTSGLAQIEALDGNGKCAPDTGSPLFANKTFLLKSGASSISNHANRVATNFYGSNSLLPGNATVNVHNANNWLGSGFLNLGINDLPVSEPRAVQSHSWIGLSEISDSQAAEANMRLDYAINRNGFVCVVGENNGSTNPLPQLLGQGYHTISVGRDDGNHSAGITTLDGSGRSKPDIVAPSASPESATSWTTPMVAGAAGLLHTRLSASPYSLTGANRPRAVKALLLASATKNTVPNWDNTVTRPLDERYGAGELNIHHAWLAMSAGRKSSGNTTHGIRGWAAEPVSGNSSKTWFFTIPAGAPATPFCAALTWHRVVNTATSGSFWNQTRTWSATLADLNLRLHQASGFTVGAQIAASSSTVDNVELVHQSALPPGSYALVVQNTSTTATDIALAWHSLPAVTVAATQPTAREIDGQAGTVTITRSGDTTLPILVPLATGGTAVSGAHYQALPSTVIIPAGQSSLALQVTPVSDSLAQGNRTLTVAAADDFSYVRNSAQSAVVTIEDKPFDTWRFANFSPAELANTAISGETADPDGDQLANLIEYGLGRPPKSPDVSPVVMVGPADHLTFTLTSVKNPAATDLIWAAEVSANLTSWDPAVIVTNDAFNFTARDNVLLTDAERRFIRLKITRP